MHVSYVIAVRHHHTEVNLFALRTLHCTVLPP